jgi:hypothetical protein
VDFTVQRAPVVGLLLPTKPLAPARWGVLLPGPKTRPSCGHLSAVAGTTRTVVIRQNLQSHFGRPVSRAQRTTHVRCGTGCSPSAAVLVWREMQVTVNSRARGQG